MKFSGFLGLLILITSLISILLSAFLGIVQQDNIAFFAPYSFGIFSFVLNIFFYYGFVKLGKYTNLRMLRFSSWSIIVFFLALLIVSPIISFSRLASAQMFPSSSFSSPSLSGAGFGIFGAFLVVLILVFSFISFFMLVAYVLFGIAMIKVGKKIKFAKLAGILSLIAIILIPIIFVISLFMAVSTSSPNMVSGFLRFSYIFPLLTNFILFFQILALFDASKKFEN